MNFDDLTVDEKRMCKKEKAGWIGVDFDGTLVEHNFGEDFGAPISRMVDRVRLLIGWNVEVRIFTARCNSMNPQFSYFISNIGTWMKDNLGKEIEYTCAKDHELALILDDIAIPVQRNEGRIAAVLTWEDDPVPAKPAYHLSVPQILRDSGQTFEDRDKVYGSNYKNFGNIMAGLFPNGLKVSTPEEWARLGVFVQIASKMGRYAMQFSKGGHQDSARDTCVYGAMLEELTHELK